MCAIFHRTLQKEICCIPMSKSYGNEGMLSQGAIYIAAFILRASFHGAAVMTTAFQYGFKLVVLKVISQLYQSSIDQLQEL